MGLTYRLAEFAVQLQFVDLPNVVIKKSKQLLMDCLGNQIGAYGELAPQIVYDALKIGAQSGPSTVVGWGVKVPTAAAALMNGMLAHTLDMDDAHRDSLTKTGSAITPAALAVAEAVEASGQEVLTAIVAGYEVMIRLGLAVNPSHRKRGFHSTATLGAFGAVTAAGRLMKLSSEQMASAFGIAGTQSSGLVAFINNPSMIKAFNVGRGVQSGVMAATLASRGFVGPSNILEHNEGFLKAYTDSVKVEHLTERLGQHFHTLESGFKPHAACRYAHGPIDAALAMMQSHGFAAADIDSVDVFVSELAYRQSNFYEPKNVTSAQGSAPFSIAAGIVCQAKSLTVKNVKEAFEIATTWELHRRVHMHIDAGMNYMGRGCRMIVRLKSGVQYESIIDLPRGEPENPMMAEEVAEKFFSQVRPILGEEQAGNIRAIIDQLETCDSVHGLMESTAKRAPERKKRERIRI